MDTKFLESFLIFAESGSLVDAARKLDITPAALAQRLRSLEASVGTKLLSRSGQRTLPTRAGLAIVEQARQLLNRADLDTDPLLLFVLVRAIEIIGEAASGLKIRMSGMTRKFDCLSFH